MALLPALGATRPAVRVPGARPLEPERGLRCNPAKLLLDPYAKAVDGDLDWSSALFPYPLGDAGSANDPDRRHDMDSAPHMAKGVVINPYFGSAGGSRPQTDYHNTVVYEAHVKGMTARDPDLPAEIRGTYAGVAHPAVVEHLTRLGVTALELMPVHQFVQDSHLKDRGVPNYWGYDTIGFFAPHHAYSASGTLSGQVQEFKTMIEPDESEPYFVCKSYVGSWSISGSRPPCCSAFGAVPRRAASRRAWLAGSPDVGETMSRVAAVRLGGEAPGRGASVGTVPRMGARVRRERRTWLLSWRRLRRRGGVAVLWWQTLLVAVAGVALALIGTTMVGLFNRRASSRAEWFRRVQWAQQLTVSHSGRVQAAGYNALEALAGSTLATREDLHLLERLSYSPALAEVPGEHVDTTRLRGEHRWQ